MNRKKFLVLVSGLVLVLSFVQPYVLPFGPADKPPAVAPNAEVDADIVVTLRNAEVADKRRVVGVYQGLKTVLTRDAGKRVANTEQWAELQARTLEMAIDTPGKYPGLDRQIEAVFLRCVGTDDVVPTNAETQRNLIRAADIIANSATR
jgi:hypothetical protein